MKRFKCHKEVEAAQIRAGEVREDRSAKWNVGDGEIIETPPEFVARGVPQEGDYIIRYEPDGYLSWSPKAVFEAGYSEL